MSADSSPSPLPRAAVIDIGSNSIKVLVAERGPDGLPRGLLGRTIEARISAGISRDRPRLGEEGMARGVAAVRELAAEAAAFGPARTALVATSAVRDAANGPEFCARVLAATGHAVRILTGDEEAALIGRGLTCDPALVPQRDFYLFDLGGGSLECLAFRGRRPEARVSLPLGCVRLTEKFVADPSGPIRAAETEAIARHVRDAMASSGFAFGLPAGATAVGTGGTLTAARAIRAAEAGLALGQSSSSLPVALLRDLLARAGAIGLEARRAIPGLPPGRADVFPAALATLIALADLGGFPAYVHSLHNLRWGLAAELLG